MSHYTIIILLSLLIIVSHFYQVISKRTNIPAVLLLMITGIAAKFFLPTTLFSGAKESLGIIGNIGLILIVLEAAIDLRLKKDKIPNIIKATLSALIGLTTTVAVASAIIVWLFPTTDWMQACLYAVPFSVMSSAIVIPSVSSIHPIAKEFIIYESSISDILGIIFFYLFLDLNQSSNVGDVVGMTAFKLGIAIILAFILSYALIWIFVKIKSETKLFLMIAALLLLFGVGKLYHLSSLIIILIFGLLLGNTKLFFRGKLAGFFDKEGIDKIGSSLHHITLESSFVLKTFFFFLFGLSINLSNLLHLKGLFVGIVIVVFTYVVRYLILHLLVLKKTNLLTMITPRGLISILLFFSIPESLFIEGFGNASMLLTIFVTNCVMAYGLIEEKKKQPMSEHDIGFIPENETIEENSDSTNEIID